MDTDFTFVVLNLGLAAASLVIGFRILRATRGGMGGSWKWLVAGLGLFALTSLDRAAEVVVPILGGRFEIRGSSEILELAYIALFVVGILTQVTTYRRLSKN